MSFCVPSGQVAHNTRFRSAAPVLGTLAFFCWPAAESLAQSTVVIGGSGRPAVEVNLDVLDAPRGQPSSTGRRLLMPGERPGDVVRLRLPGSGTQGPAASEALPPALRPPAPAPRIRVAPPAAEPMPALSPPIVTQRAVQAPAPAVARVMPPAPPPPRPASQAPSPAPARAVVKAPTPSPAAQPGRAERQVAALPKVPLLPAGGQVLRIDFLGASTRLTPDAERKLASLAATMVESDGRLQLKAYAGGTGETFSAARRLSLSRALAVRSFLIEQGIRSTRLDVRALGRAVDNEPPERVDIVLLIQ